MRLLTSILLLVLPAAASAQTTDPRAARLDSVFAALHADGLFDGAFAVSDSAGRVVYSFAAGDYEGQPVTPQTPIYLASVSKAMTATAVLSLVAEGAVDLDAPVGRYLDPWSYPDVTVRHLLDQTSGLHFLTTLTAHRDTTRAVTTADLLALSTRTGPVSRSSRARGSTTTTPTTRALGALIEAVTGQPYADVLRRRVAIPAEMANARVESSGEVEWSAWAGGGGEVVTASAIDLLAFDDAFWSGRLLPDSLVHAARRPPMLADGTPSDYVFGRFLTDDPRSLIGHMGEGERAKSALWRERETGTTYAILVAGAGIHRTAILTAAMAIWNGEPFGLPSARTVADVPDNVLARHVGSYSSGMGLLHITLQDGQLHLEPEGAGGSEPLVPASETVFYFGEQDLTWEFVVDGDGRTTGLMLRGHPETLGERVE